METSSPPQRTYYFSMMKFRLVALDKCLGVCLMEIGETLFWDLAKLVLRTSRDQANIA